MGGMSQCRVIALWCVLVVVLLDHRPFCGGASWIAPLHQWFERRHHGDHPPPPTDRSHPLTTTTPTLSSPRSSRFPSMTSLSLQPDRSSNFFATRTFYNNDTTTRTDQSQDLLRTTLPSPMGKVNDYLNTLSKQHDLTRTTGTTNENHILLMAEEELDLVTVRPPQMTMGTRTATSGLPDDHSNDDHDDGDNDDDDDGDAIKSTTAAAINSHGNNGMFHQPRISNVRKNRDDSNATTGVPQRDQQQRWSQDAPFAVQSTLPPYLSLEPVGSSVSLLETTRAEDWDELSHSIQGVLTATFVSSMYQYICSDHSTVLNDDLHTMIIFMQPFVLTYLSTTQSMIGQTLRMLGDVTNLWTTAIVQQVFDNDTAAHNTPLTKNPVWNKIQNTFMDIPTRTWQWWSDLTNDDVPSSSPSATTKSIPVRTKDAASNDFFFASVKDTTVKQPHPPIRRPSIESIPPLETNRVTYGDDEIDIDRLLQLAQEMQQELPYRGLNVVSEAVFVPDQICELEGKLREAQASLEQKSDMIDDLKERLGQSTNHDIASTKAHEREVQRLRREIKALQDRFATECGKRKAVVARLHENLKEKSNLVSKLEGMLSIASTRGESMDQRMKEAEDAIRKTKAALIAERTNHVSAKEQTRVDLAVLQDKLRASEASLQEKRATVEELEDQLRSIVDESATTNMELQKEVDQLRTEMKTLNEQLDNDRAELFTKSESLKQQQEMLQQNAEEIVSLQQTIAPSTQSDEQRNREMSQLTASLDQAVADLEAERVETNTTVTRLQDHLVQTESKLHNLEATLQETHDLLAEQQEQLRVLANNSSTSEKDYQNQLECLQRTTEEQLAELNVVVQTKEAQIEELQSRVAALLETSSRLNELEAQLSNATTAELNMKLELDSVKSELSTTMQSFEAQQSNRTITERQLNARIGELEETLRASSLDLEKKQAAICDLEENVKRASDESMASMEQLTTEIKALQSEIEMSNDLLQKERASMAAKVEECEQLRIVVQEQINAEAARLEAEKEAKLAEEERKVAQALAEAETEAKLAEERKIAQALAEAEKEAKLAEEERKIAQALAEAEKEAKLAEEERKIAQALAEAEKEAKLAEEERKIAQALVEAEKEERKIAQALVEAEKEAKLAEERKIADGFRLAAIAKTEEERILKEQARLLMEERNVGPQPPAAENTLTAADAPDAILEPDTWSQPLRFAPQKQQPSWVRKTEWWE